MSAVAAEKQEGKIELVIPGQPEFLRIVRLVVSGYASRLSLPFDEVDGIKVAVSEACNNAIIHSSGNGQPIAIRCWQEDGGIVVFQVEDSGPGFERKGLGDIMSEDFDPEKEAGFGLMLIESLMDQTDIDSQPGRGTRITMKKKLIKS